NAMDIVKKTNTELYNILDNDPIIYNVTLGDLLSVTISNDPDKSKETGSSSSLNMNRETTTTTEQGFYYPLMSGTKGLKDTDDNPYNESNYLDKVYDEQTGKFISKEITIDDANKLVTLDSEQTIVLSNSLGEKDRAKILAHELGHAKFTLFNKVKSYF